MELDAEFGLHRGAKGCKLEGILRGYLAVRGALFTARTICTEVRDTSLKMISSLLISTRFHLVAASCPLLLRSV